MVYSGRRFLTHLLLEARDTVLIPGSGRSLGGGKWQPAPVFLPGESHRQRSLAGYDSGGNEESDTTEQLSTMSMIT